MNHNRDWTNEDELRWQATTQAPYFENKVPGEFKKKRLSLFQ